MWTQICRRKNSYLQKMCHDVDPCILNRVMCKAFMNYLTDPTNMEPPLLIPCSLQPCGFAPNVDPARARIAYGDWGIPQLIHQIHDDVLYNRRCALKSLTDELRAPEKCFSAIKLNIVKRFDDALDNLKKNMEEFSYEVEKICISLAIIATYLDGGLKIIDEKRIIQNLYSLINGTDCNSNKAATVLVKLAMHPKIAEEMVETGHLVMIKNVLEITDSLCPLYMELSYLIERYPAKAVAEGYFDILYPKIVENKYECFENILYCFALLMNCPQAQKYSDEKDIIPTFIQILKTEQPSSVIYENAALTIKNCTLTRTSRWRCREFWDLPLILIQHAHSKENHHLQLYSLQILRQITEMPSVKDFVSKCCKANIKNIDTFDKPDLTLCKFKLLKWLRHRNYRIDIEVDNYDKQEYNENPLTVTRRITDLKDDNEDDDNSKLIYIREKSPDIAYRIDKKPKYFFNDTESLSVKSYTNCNE